MILEEKQGVIEYVKNQESSAYGKQYGLKIEGVWYNGEGHLDLINGDEVSFKWDTETTNHKIPQDIIPVKVVKMSTPTAEEKPKEEDKPKEEEPKEKSKEEKPKEDSAFRPAVDIDKIDIAVGDGAQTMAKCRAAVKEILGDREPKTDGENAMVNSLFIEVGLKLYGRRFR